MVQFYTVSSVKARLFNVVVQLPASHGLVIIKRKLPIWFRNYRRVYCDVM